MGFKSRENWPVNICLKEDCANRGKECDHCVQCNKYERIEEDG